MRIVEPQKTRPVDGKQQTPRRNKKRQFILFSLAVAIVIGYFFILTNNSADPIPEEPALVENNDSTEVTADNSEPELMTFSGNEFRILYDQLLQPNMDKVDTPPPITGNDIADTRIRQIAEARGYRLRSSPTNALPYVDGYLLQPSVALPWRSLKRLAAQEGLELSITSAYRSVEAQRQLFLGRLTALGVTYSDIAKGLADEQIDTTLITTAAPGYSKHHTGYTVDFYCAGYAFENFKNSTCNDWLADNNFQVAKENGFIPSYPPDADLQGPEPEAWEYVWVGTEVLYSE